MCRSKLNTPDGGATPTSLPAAGESSSGVYFSHRCAPPGRTIEASSSDVRGRVPHHTSGLESTVRDSEVRSKYRLSITKGASRGRQWSDSGSILLTSWLAGIQNHKDQQVNSGTLLPVPAFRNIVDDVMNEMLYGIYSALNISCNIYDVIVGLRQMRWVNVCGLLMAEEKAVAAAVQTLTTRGNKTQRNWTDEVNALYLFK